jgi:hypothetical protein
MPWRGPKQVPFLTDEWCAMFEREGEDVPGWPGATATIVIVADHQGDRAGFTIRLLDGVVTGVEASTTADADLRVEFTGTDLQKYLRGDVDPVHRSYWVGNLRLIGDQAVVESVAPLVDSDEFRALFRRVHDATDW